MSLLVPLHYVKKVRKQHFLFKLLVNSRNHGGGEIIAIESQIHIETLLRIAHASGAKKNNPVDCGVMIWKRLEVLN